MGRWIAGILITIALLGAALAASSASTTAPPEKPTLADDFSLGAIASSASR